MGWSFLRSVNAGPIKLNLTGAGVGLSVGVRGARVAFGPRGTYVNIGGGGLRYRRKLSDRTVPEDRSPQSEPSAPAGAIETAAVDSLQEASLGDVVAELQQRRQRVNLTVLHAVVAAAGSAALLMFSQAAVWSLPIVGLLFATLAVTYPFDRDRRSTRLIYDLDDAATLKRVAFTSAVGEALNQTHYMWHVLAQREVEDSRYHAGASELLARTPIRIARTLPRGLETNVETWSVPVGPQRLYFLPDSLVIEEGKKLAGVPYETVLAEANETRFIEEDHVPPDSTVVDHTWKYVNKSGTPDKRFADNRELPIVLYGELEIRSRQGVRVLLQLSSTEAAEQVALALNRLHDEASGTSTGAGDTGALPAREEATGLSAGDRKAVAVAAGAILHYVALADRRFKPEEKETISQAVTSICGSEFLAEAALEEVLGAKPAPDIVRKYCALLREHVTEKTLVNIFDVATTVAEADGKATPKERERLTEIEGWLGLRR